MKVLMINVMCGITSTGRICTDIADVLTSRGDECKIAYGRGIVPEKDQKYAIKIGGDFGVKLHALASRIFDDTGFHSTQATKKLLKWIDTYNPDIIHLHNLHGYYINIELLFNYLKAVNKPVIWTLHDCWAFTGHCSHYSLVGCEKWKGLCSNCPQKREYPASVLCDNSSKNHKRKSKLFNGLSNLCLVTPSVWLRNELSCSFLSDCTAQIINNGIDLNVFRPVASRFKEQHCLKEKKVVLGVANIWTQRKGLNDFIKLAAELDEDYQVVLVGNIQNVQLPNNILHIKPTNSTKELAEIYSAANVFVNPTYEDNFPTTNLESLACGTPVITYKTGGSPEVIDSKNGLVLERGDWRGIAAAIRDNNFDPSYCAEYAKKFDKKACFGKYISLYEEMLQ